MNLRDLRYVVAVAELGQFGRAASACNVSQPTLSGQILKLEEELGVQIFERDGRVARLTERGATIVAHARRVVGAADDLRAAAAASRDPLDGPIRLGIIATVGPYLAPWLLPAAARDLPRAPIRLVEDLTGHLLPLLADGKLDAAIIATDPPGERLEEAALYDEPFCLMAPPNHPLARKKAVRVSDIDPRSLLLLADGHCLRDQALDICGHPDLGHATGADMRAASLETLLHMAAAGHGLTLAPQMAADGWRGKDGLVAVPLKGADVARRVRLVWRRDMPRKAAMAAL
ncbi:MAG TPA: LysR substrate-binding domain-containing protein, partial [Beijerinckiaceae bacterium]|nr:LysR substrate-binding domain-containing protein [Beijerinckiaceae bacterium]